MVVQLTPDQITAMWDSLKDGIRSTLPPIAGRHEMAMANILTSLMKGNVQMWAGFKGEEEGTPDAVALTTIIIDPVTNNRKLLIYSLVKFSLIDFAILQEGMEEFRIFAQYYKCHSIVAYTQQDNIVSIAKKLGADTSWTYIHMEV